MNEDYLWNKTGRDADIERLEAALAVFRHRSGGAPRLPQAAVGLTSGPRPRWFRLGFAVAFAAVSVSIASAVWFLTPRAKLSTVAVADSATRSPQFVDRRSPDDAVRPNYEVAVAKDRFGRREHHVVVQKVRDNGSTAKQTPGTLTAKERYAYDQLMLALSITSSKLKIVHDALAGDEPVAPARERPKDLIQK